MTFKRLRTCYLQGKLFGTVESDRSKYGTFYLFDYGWVIILIQVGVEQTVDSACSDCLVTWLG